MYEIVQQLILKWQEKRKIPPKITNLYTYNPVILVLVQNHTKGPFDPKYVGDYQGSSNQRKSS